MCGHVVCNGWKTSCVFGSVQHIMSNDPSPDLVAAVQETQTAEVKRREARRRFLLRTTATSGVAIVTLCHQRIASAENKLVSSEAVCASIGGRSLGQVQGSIPGVMRVKCHL